MLYHVKIVILHERYVCLLEDIQSPSDHEFSWGPLVLAGHSTVWIFFPTQTLQEPQPWLAASLFVLFYIAVAVLKSACKFLI